jgi:anti-sigma-K factor RskA
MKEDVEFQEIGKRTPYKAPDGFFESVSEKTLQRAKRREQSHRKNLTLWRTMAVAASLFAVVSLGYYLSEPEITPKTKTDVIVMEKHPDVQLPIVQKPEIDQQSTVNVPKKATPAKVIEIPAPAKEKMLTVENDSEALKDVLADLTDEELLEMDAMYKTDPMIGESEQ